MSPEADQPWPDDLVQLYRERFGDLVRVAYLMTGQLGVAEERTQDAFVAAQPLIGDVAAPYAYLRAAVVNNARSWHRRRRLEFRKRPDPPDPALNEPDEMWGGFNQTTQHRR